MKFYTVIIAIVSVFIMSCSKTDDDTTNTSDMYFPPLTGETWQTATPASLNWNEQELELLKQFLEQNETRAFIVLVDGKIVVEEYWNTDLAGQAFNMNSNWYWASAGKSLTGTLIGIAQEQGLLNINDKTSDYLGNGWTNMSQDKENLITIKDHLSFTTGIDYNVTNQDCYAPSCFNYLSDAGSQWYYHNATYLITHDLLQAATGVNNNQYTTSAISDKIGMIGMWLNTAQSSNVYFSNARSAARFGLLTLNRGVWDNTTVLGDTAYFNAMTNTSQNLNESYGYLWWLNGKNSTMFPGSTAVVPTSITPAAPDDMISALGKDGQFIDVIPSLNMVLIRMGDTTDQQLVPVLFHNELWNKMNSILP